MKATVAKCGHRIVAVGAPNSLARMKTESIPCEECQQKENAISLKWKECPACGWIYDCTKLQTPQVDLNIRCACCCQ